MWERNQIKLLVILIFLDFEFFKLEQALLRRKYNFC